MSLRFNAHSASGNANGILAGADLAGTSLFMGNSYPKVKGLSAKIVCDIETDTLTMTAIWQISNDASTWLDVANGTQNAASVVVGTGTAGADALITKVFNAPEAVYGAQWCRLVLRVGVATGATADTYAITYNYRTLTGAESWG